MFDVETRVVKDLELNTRRKKDKRVEAHFFFSGKLDKKKIKNDNIPAKPPPITIT